LSDGAWMLGRGLGYTLRGPGMFKNSRLCQIFWSSTRDLIDNNCWTGIIQLCPWYEENINFIILVYFYPLLSIIVLNGKIRKTLSLMFNPSKQFINGSSTKINKQSVLESQGESTSFPTQWHSFGRFPRCSQASKIL